MTPELINPRQKIYAADGLKVFGTAQLAGVGIEEIASSGCVGLGLLAGSIVLRAIAVLLGLELLRDEPGDTLG